MIKKFIYLEWKSFSRSASFGVNVALKIVIAFLVAYFAVVFIALGVGVFYLLKDMNLDPLLSINKFLLYYFLFDLVIRLLMQAIPVLNIKPLLTLAIQKKTIVHFSVGKTALSFFNIIHAFFFIPFAIILLIEGYDIIGVIFWLSAIVSLIYINNFLNILLSNIDKLFVIFLGIIAVLGGLQYYNFFNITNYTVLFFNGLYNMKGLFLVPVLVLIGLYYVAFKYFKNNLYLDAGLSDKHDIAATENLTWLNQFGTLGTFLKNDIKLIKRNKRSKMTIIMSLFFLLYGLLFFSANTHQQPVMQILAGIFVSGGFLFTFGQFVPSWDSSYYQLMMTQNIPYKGYITSKWWLIVIATVVSTIIASFYLYFGWKVYLTIVVGAIYNIGVNSHLVLLGGAFTKTPIDLTSTSGAFGDKKAFNVNAMLLTLPKMLLPLGLYWIGIRLGNPNIGLALVALAGIIGFAFKDKVFLLIEKRYKIEKYSTISAYKQKN
ncbi:DUF5687 family protein [Flavobacterium sp. LS1R49]|uniref:DUF5687 family protein n=1 Tax=Flavobacterium shii TaxID=2987687 RepID=A0A9X2ZJ88_9FLAO|nr:DUF5687 family protein [Flavobacterium shii]MCV9929717.1 DUF5687 family protein [Flavobacterium shii]